MLSLSVRKGAFSASTHTKRAWEGWGYHGATMG